MNTDLKDSQFELFPGETKSYSPPRSRYFWSQITLSLENVIVVSIAIILLMVFSFSLGVMLEFIGMCVFVAGAFAVMVLTMIDKYH